MGGFRSDVSTHWTRYLTLLGNFLVIAGGHRKRGDAARHHDLDLIGAVAIQRVHEAIGIRKKCERHVLGPELDVCVLGQEQQRI